MDISRLWRRRKLVERLERSEWSITINRVHRGQLDVHRNTRRRIPLRIA